MNWLFSAYNYLLDPGLAARDYKKNKVDRLERQPQKRIGVSTANTRDFGFETALMDANGAHPVERYETLEEAKKGHEKWVLKSQNIKKAIKLGTQDGLVPDREVIFCK